MADLGAGSSVQPLLTEQPLTDDTTAGWCYGVRAVQEILGHSDAKTSMVCIHVPNRGPCG